MLFSPREQACQNMWLTPLVLRSRVDVRQPSVSRSDKRTDHPVLDGRTDFVVTGSIPVPDKTLSLLYDLAPLARDQLCLRAPPPSGPRKVSAFVIHFKSIMFSVMKIRTPEEEITMCAKRSLRDLFCTYVGYVEFSWNPVWFQDTCSYCFTNTMK